MQRYFKTGPGEYGAGDRFLGIAVPPLRRLAREFRALPFDDVCSLLTSPWHEERLVALFLWVDQFGRGGDTERKRIYDAYLLHTRYINNWDLVDASAPGIVGAFLATRSRRPLLRLAKSNRIWERRIAVLATASFIRNGEFDDTLALAELLIADREDLIHKAVGWMLREVHKRDSARACAFLDHHAGHMPRTMLRYAIERMGEPIRRHYLAAAGLSAKRIAQAGD
jgi:3-methyladenine DNA glycosylase AlkD